MGLFPRPAARLSTGSIHMDKLDLAGLPESHMRHFRGDRMAMIFQEPMTSLNPVLLDRATDHRGDRSPHATVPQGAASARLTR